MKFTLEIHMEDKMFENEPLAALANLVLDVSERLEAHALVDTGINTVDGGDGVIWNGDGHSIGRFNIA